MAGRREGVELLAGELPAAGDQLGADALRNEPGRVTSGDAGPERVLPVAWLPMGS
jgi:hypothetical protein